MTQDESSCTLVINNVQEETGGFYTLFGENSVGEVNFRFLFHNPMILNPD